MTSAVLTSKRAEWINNTIQDALGCKDTVWEVIFASLFLTFKFTILNFSSHIIYIV